jgi:hypothetical protein
MMPNAYNGQCDTTLDTSVSLSSYRPSATRISGKSELAEAMHYALAVGQILAQHTRQPVAAITAEHRVGTGAAPV